MITVKELIDKLSEFNPNLYIAIMYDSDHETHCLKVGHKHGSFGFLKDGEIVL